MGYNEIWCVFFSCFFHHVVNHPRKKHPGISTIENQPSKKGQVAKSWDRFDTSPRCQWWGYFLGIPEISAWKIGLRYGGLWWVLPINQFRILKFPLMMALFQECFKGNVGSHLEESCQQHSSNIFYTSVSRILCQTCETRSRVDTSIVGHLEVPW